MPCVTKQMVQAAPKRPPLRVEIPELGEGTYVFVRAASGNDRDALEAAMVQLGEQRLQNLRARVFLWSTINDAGEPIFANEDLAWLGEQDSVMLDRVFEANAKHNGIFKNASDAKPGETSSPGDTLPLPSAAAV